MRWLKKEGPSLVALGGRHRGLLGNTEGHRNVGIALSSLVFSKAATVEKKVVMEVCVSVLFRE